MTTLAYPEREQALCIGVVQSAGAFEAAVRGGVLDDHFTQPVCGAVWSCVRKLREAGESMRWAVLEEALRQTPYLEAAKQLLRAVKSTPTLSDKDAASDADKVVSAARARHAQREVSGALSDLSGAEDPQTALREFNDRTFALSMSQPQARSNQSVMEVLSEVFTDISDMGARLRKITGVPFHIAGVDGKLRGAQPGKVTIVAARPGVGKTAFLTTAVARQVELHDAEQAPMQPCLFFSLEMSKKELVQRLLCEMAKISYERMMFGDHPSQVEMRRLVNAADKQASSPLEIDDENPLTVEQIAASIYRWHRKLWPRGCPKGAHASVYIDYLTIIARSPGIKDEQAHVRHCMMVLNAVAKKTGVSIVLLCQLTRLHVNEGRWPEPSDLRGGGEIEEGAFAIVMLHPLGRQEDADAGKTWRGLIVAIVAKNRGGAQGTVMLHYQGECYDFREWNPHTDGPIEDVLHGTGRPQQQARQAKPAKAKAPAHTQPRGGPPTVMPAHRDA